MEGVHAPQLLIRMQEQLDSCQCLCECLSRSTMCVAREEMRSVYKPVRRETEDGERRREEKRGEERRRLVKRVFCEGGITTGTCKKEGEAIEKTLSLLLRQVNLSPTHSFHIHTQKTFY